MMESKTQHGYLVLGDISGFTSFMAATELEHAHDILSELLELIVQHLTPTFTLVELEGDAVYVCAPENSIPQGETVLELFQSTYVAFKDRVEAIRRNTTCTCNACRLIPTLDLKFITSCGNYILQSVAGTSKPIGSDVNLVHRLAKNHVAETTGWHAYALFTETTLKHMGLDPKGMHEQIENYEHLGEIKTYSVDLLAYYQEFVAARRVFVKPDAADFCVTLDIAAPPPVLWDYLNDPRKKMLWDLQHKFTADKIDGRRGAGMQNHCIHGDNSERIQTVLDWRPFEYFTQDDRNPKSAKPDLLLTNYLTPTATP